MEARRTSRRAGGIGFLFATGCVACSAILGIDDLPLATDGGAPGSSGAITQSNGTVSMNQGTSGTVSADQGTSGGSHASTGNAPPGQSTSAAGMTGAGSTSVSGGGTTLASTMAASTMSASTTPPPGTSSSSVAMGGSSSVTNSSSSSSSGSSSSNSFCSAGTGGIALDVDAYQTTIGEGYCYSYSDSSAGCSPCGSSTACLSPANLCAQGIAVGYEFGAANYGGGLGCNVNQTRPDAGPATASPLQLTGSGITYTLLSLPPYNAVSMTINVGGTEYYCPITSTSGTCPWSAFAERTTGVALTAAPATTHVQFQVGSNAEDESWSLCITSMGIAPATTSATGGLGDLCASTNDCLAGYGCLIASGGSEGFCTTTCTEDSDCAGLQAGGENAQGTLNGCVQYFDQLTSEYVGRCFSECGGAAQCSALAPATCESVINSTGQFYENVCDFN